MQTRTRNTQRSFIRRHALVLVVIVGLIAMSGAIIWWFWHTIEAETSAIRSQKEAFIQDIDREIAAIEARKAEEERQRRAARATEVANQIASNPAAADRTIDARDCNVSGERSDPSRIDVLVNKKHCLQPLRFVPTDLETRFGATLSAKAMPSFIALMNEARAAGLPLSVTSSYRSFDTQVQTYNYWVSVSGVAVADTYSARPGYSEHQTGLAVDFANATGTCSLSCFGGSAEYQWLRQHGHRFGFIQRYHASTETVTGFGAEPWHWRYVGTEIAQALRQKGLLTLEALWGLPGGTY